MLRTWLLVFCLGLAATAPAQDFKDSDRFGMSSEAIVGMGHDEWVKWYCDDARRGPSSRVGAERVYCLAVHDATAPLLARRSKGDQQFFSDIRSYFADLAKTSFGVGLGLTGSSDAWSLPIAQSSTAINETLYRMLKQDSAIVKEEPGQLDALAKQIEDRVRKQKPDMLGDATRFRGITGRIKKRLQFRPKRESLLAHSFMVQMGHLALTRPDQQ